MNRTSTLACGLGRGTTSALAALALLGAGAARAQAQPATDEEAPEANTTAATNGATTAVVPTDRMTLPKGAVLITVDLGVNLSKDAVGKPVSLAPDVWYGVSDKLSLGLVHSTRGAYGLVGATGNSLCLTGEDNGCAKLYDSVGADVRYQAYETPGDGIGVAVDGGLLVSSFDPLTLDLKVGGIVHLRSGQLALDASPAIAIGLTERDAGNKETLSLPVSVHYAVAPKVTLSAQSGVVAPLEKAADLYTVPLSVGGSYAISPKAFVGAAFTLPAVIGGKDVVVDGADLRTFTIGAGYAL